TKTEPHQDDNRNDDELNRVDQDKDKDNENEQTNPPLSNELVSSIDQQAEIKSSKKTNEWTILFLSKKPTKESYNPTSTTESETKQTRT
ncbi:unnamed protein product, partial [Rotaria sp. Silwood1]